MEAGGGARRQLRESQDIQAEESFKALSAGPGWTEGLTVLGPQFPEASSGVTVRYKACQQPGTLEQGAIPGPDAPVPGPRAAWFAKQRFLGENRAV